MSDTPAASGSALAADLKAGAAIAADAAKVLELVGGLFPGADTFLVIAETVLEDASTGASILSNPLVLAAFKAAAGLFAAETPQAKAFIAAAQDCRLRGWALDSPEALAVHPELAQDRETLFG